MRRTIAAFLSASLVLVACGDDDGEDGTDSSPPTAGDAVGVAEARLTAAQGAVEGAQGDLDAAHDAFCGDAQEYIQAIDRYGRVLDTESAATVGDVRTAGADLAEPQATAEAAGQDVVAARDDLAAAEVELHEAEVALAEAQAEAGGTPPPPTEPAPTTTTLVPTATVERIEQAETDLDAAAEGITNETALVEAGERFNAAAVSLEIAWFRLVADADCLDDEQRAQALDAVSQYASALQTDLQAVELYAGPIDGVFRPETVAAVEQLQTDNGLPVTGYVDRATSVALDAALATAGVEAAAGALTYTAAVQSALTVLGFWDGPIDGVWTEELTQAVNALQTELGVAITGAVDAVTVAAIVQRLAEAEASTETTETTATTAAPAEPTTAPAEPTTPTTAAA